MSVPQMKSSSATRFCMMFESYTDAYHAAGDGNLAATQKFIENQGVDPYFHRHMCTAAIHGGNYRVLEYIIKWGEIYQYVFKYDRSDEVLEFAIRNLVRTESTEMIAYLHQTRILSDENHELFMKRVCEIAVEECNVKMIKHLNDLYYDCPFKEESALTLAIKKDNFEMINYWINHNPRLWSLSDEEYTNMLDRHYRFAQLVHKTHAVQAIGFHIVKHFKGESKRDYARKTLLEFGIDP